MSLFYKVGAPVTINIVPNAKHSDPVFAGLANLANVMAFLQKALAVPLR